LHQFVVRDPNFPWNPKEAIRRGFAAAEQAWMKIATDAALERSGSTACVVLIISDICYVANVGDSRAVMSGFNGKKVYPLTKDHKPMDPVEQQRIKEAGGKIY
jgi:protein phosphatase 2C family protein 2/3